MVSIWSFIVLIYATAATLFTCAINSQFSIYLFIEKSIYECWDVNIYYFEI